MPFSKMQSKQLRLHRGEGWGKARASGSVTSGRSSCSQCTVTVLPVLSHQMLPLNGPSSGGHSCANGTFSITVTVPGWQQSSWNTALLLKLRACALAGCNHSAAPQRTSTALNIVVLVARAAGAGTLVSSATQYLQLEGPNGPRPHGTCHTPHLAVFAGSSPARVSYCNKEHKKYIINSVVTLQLTRGIILKRLSITYAAHNAIQSA